MLAVVHGNGDELRAALGERLLERGRKGIRRLDAVTPRAVGLRILDEVRIAEV